MKYWLMKSEPSAYSIDDLKRDKFTSWNGVRNYQARNYMRDEMRAGDKVLFYASNADPSGVSGVAEVVKEAHPEKEEPWVMVDIGFVEKFGEVVPLDTLKTARGLENMVVTKKGSRLSVQPVTKPEFDIVVKLGRKGRSSAR
ncbi:MAG TPA: EVE domain-containing protein [Thermoanaerobaculia bacterium]|jgi:predicted RNA-binding protein with PUA-like domain|nr:EVE domain-containing protein [Thermoanaerobaculia bacterium]